MAAPFICIASTRDQPWIRPFDIRDDGVFGLDDVLAYVSDPDPKGDPVDMCTVSRIGLLKQEVIWKLKTLLAGKLARREKNAPEIDVLESDALKRLQVLASDRPNRIAAVENRATIVELCLRAKTVVVNPASEPFGIGVSMKPNSKTEDGWPMVVTDVMPESGAARSGIRRGDYLIAVGGVPFFKLSSDGTVPGLYDPQTQMSRGFNGSWDSVMPLQIQRSTGELVELQVRRNIWSARHLGTPNTLPLWDGKAMPKGR